MFAFENLVKPFVLMDAKPFKTPGAVIFMPFFKSFPAPRVTLSPRSVTVRSMKDLRQALSRYRELRVFYDGEMAFQR